MFSLLQELHFRSLATCAFALALAAGVLMPPQNSYQPPVSASLPVLSFPPQPLTYKKEFSILTPVVLYHHVRDITPRMTALEKGLSITPAHFRMQLDELQKSGFHTITLPNLMDAIHARTTLTPKTIILTFDDGYDNLYTQVYPLLKTAGMTGVAFIPTEKIGTPGYVTWDQLREMDHSGIIDVQSHTLTHADLTHIPRAQADQEIKRSKEVLEQMIGKQMKFFCYPYGSYSQSVMESVKQNGYTAAFTTKFGTRHSANVLYELPRVRLNESDIGVKLSQKITLFEKSTR